MRKGIDSLCGMVRNELGKDPLSGELFIFFCRQRRRVKILLWDEDGFALYQKRLERGTFEMPEGNTAHQDISAGQLNLILSGVNLKKVSHRPRYQHTIHNAFTGHVV
jgi:transposase